MHQNKEQLAKGRGKPQALEVINLGLATDCNTSGYKLLIEKMGKILKSNQVRLDETFFQRRNRHMIDDQLSNITQIDVVSLDRGDMKWIKYNSSINLNDIENVHSGA